MAHWEWATDTPRSTKIRTANWCDLPLATDSAIVGVAVKGQFGRHGGTEGDGRARLSVRPYL